jgi:hypothetical protein
MKKEKNIYYKGYASGNIEGTHEEKRFLHGLYMR